MFDSVIIAGGKSSRMDGDDKGLITFNNKPLIEYPINLLKNYNSKIIISANRNLDFYNKYAKTITDEIGEFFGPLAGIYSAINYLELNNTKNKYLLVLPIDTPLLSKDNINKLLDIKNYDISVAFDGENIHPTIMLIKQELIISIDNFLADGERKLGKWIKQHNYQKVLIDKKHLKNINYKFDLTSDLT